MCSTKKECFAYDKYMGRCMLLRQTYCKWEECRFYKKKGTLCNGCPDKGNDSICDRCREVRRG